MSPLSADAGHSVLEVVERLAASGSDPAAILDEAVRLLADRLPHYSWVGIYLVVGEELVLGPWQGPHETEHTRIPIGRGICGAAAATGRTEIVDDVHADERYLACFPSTRSEIVVPIAHEGRVVGEIDIDSDLPAAFDENDRTFLEQVAALVSSHAAEAGASAAAAADCGPASPGPSGRA